MRLTVDLINESLSYINPLKERELDLRGHKIPALENLAPAQHHDALDLTDNSIPSLANFPNFPRLKSLYCARNRINHISPSLARSIPNIETLVLSDNSIAELADLEPLRHFRKLTYISLGENPVAAKENYRLWLIFLNPHIRFLDFRRVRDAERTAARDLFGTSVDEEPTEATRKIMAVRSRKPLVAGGANGAEEEVNGQQSRIRVKLTDEERKRIEKLVMEAKSLKEIERLERMLAEGRVPG